MPRPAKVSKRSQNGCCSAKINGVQERLSADFEEAKEMFHKLKSKARKGKKKKPGSGKISTTLEAACNAFLDHSKKETAERTFENRRGYLQSFCDPIGKGRRVRDVTKKQSGGRSFA